MQFKSAEKGIRKLFLGEILSIAATIALIAAMVYLGIRQIDVNSSGDVIMEKLESSGMLVPFLVFTIGGLVLFLVSYFMTIAGLIKGAHDEDSFKKALWAELLVLALTVASYFFQNSNPQLVKWLNVVSTVARMMVTLLVISGIDRIAEALGKKDVVAIGEKDRFILIGTFVLSAIFELALVFLFENNQTMTTFFGITIYVLDIIAYVQYLRLLARGRLMSE